MSTIIPIQADIFCEPCKHCGARPVVEQKKGKFAVICPTNREHYKGKAGIVDVADWNKQNKPPIPFVKNIQSQQKAS